MKRIFLDAAAGRVNPSGLHAEGLAARERLAVARQEAADFLGARPAEIVFTSGGTESNNLAILGLDPKAVMTTEIEHASILQPCHFLAQRGTKVSYLPLDRYGRVRPELFLKSLSPATNLITFAYAHNEIGTIQPVGELAKAVRRFRKTSGTATPYFHLDACQAPRYLELKVQKLGVDLLTLNGAKLGVPGIGLLYVRTGVPLRPIVYGGGQESGRRSGTESVAAAELFARALSACAHGREKEVARLVKLRDYFIAKLLRLPGASLNGHPTERLPNNVNITFAGVETEQLVLELDARGVAVSSGSACSTNFYSDAILRREGVRFSFDEKTKRADLDYVLKILPPIIERLRKFNVL